MRARANYIAIANDIGASDKAIALPEQTFLGGIGLVVLCIAYCDRQRTDGRVPANALKRVIAPGVDTAAVIQDLLAVGWLLERDDGYEVADYLTWQRSKAEIEQSIKQKREAGALGGKSKAANARVLEDKNDQNDKIGEERSVLSTPLSTLPSTPLSTPLDGKPMTSMDTPACLSAPLTLTEPAYTGTCIGFIVHAMQEQFGADPTPSEFAELKAAIATGCIPGCDGSHPADCALLIAHKLRTKGKTTFRTSRLWLKCVREDRMEARQ